MRSGVGRDSAADEPGLYSGQDDALANAKITMGDSVPITCVGDLMWFIGRPLGDLPTPNTTCVVKGDEAKLGGSALHIAEHLIFLGQRVDFVALTGAADEQTVSSELKLRNIDGAGLIPYDGPTNVLIAFVGKKSARSIFIRGRNTSRAMVDLHDRLVGPRVMIFGGSRDELVRSTVLDCVEKGSCRFVFAPSYSVFRHRPDELLRFSKLADLVVLNAHEFQFFANAIGGKRAAIARTRCCIVTQAHRGATVHVKSRKRDIPSRSGSTVDVIGAGDAFLAGFMVSWLKDGDPFQAGEAGSKFAANFVRSRVANSEA